MISAKGHQETTHLTMDDPWIQGWIQGKIGKPNGITVELHGIT
jgi:hypothetical protein